jgi:hypothetical protein
MISTRHRGSRQRAFEREDVAVTSIIARGLWVQLAQRRLGVLQYLSIWLLNTFGCDGRFPDLNVGRLYRPVAIVICLMPTVHCHYIRYGLTFRNRASYI